MTPAKKLQCLLMAIYVVCAILNGMEGDWRKALYWFAATLLTISLTF